ncbi:MAG: nitrite/sulfite reductase [Chitinophagales bacterium]
MSVNISNATSNAASKDIRELEHKISGFNNGTIPEDRFKAYRLTRGVYGQRQFGVHMFRTKLPYGRINAAQLKRMGEMSTQYATGNLHLTTRQNIQLHYVKLDDSPAVWAGLADVGVTAREACGNTVRNITASAIAGIDPNEPFDVVPYANAAFEYFLRNPICQDMGRKIKIAFSSSEQDSAFIYIHDFGFIPKIKSGQRGFKVLVGGGLGAQSIMAHTAYEFLEEDRLIPFMEAALRIFDRYGERAKRNKARMKYLVSDLGLEKWQEMVNEEWKALENETIKIDTTIEKENIKEVLEYPSVEIENKEKYQQWLQTNTFQQKQAGYYGVYLKVLKGDIDHEEAYKIADVVEQYAASEMRVTVNQGLLVRYVKEEALPILFNAFDALGFAEPGFDSLHDITVCPGTDTCALGVTNSMGLAKVLERVVKEEYPDLMHERFLKIKMSGCMNACGQHMIAQLGFHGSSIRVDEKIAPAMQVVVGGGVDIDGTGHIADKIIKIPTRRIPDVVRRVLDDYEDQATEGEYFNAYYTRQGKKYFYDLLKDLGHKDSIEGQDFVDWGHDEEYIQEIGVGECAGVSYDMVSTIINDAEIKLQEGKEVFENGLYNEAGYHAYTGMVIGAKALLLAVDVACNTQAVILTDFDQHLVAERGFKVPGGSIEQLALQIKMTKPTQAFASQFVSQLEAFIDDIKAFRKNQVEQDKLAADKLVVDNYYKA